MIPLNYCGYNIFSSDNYIKYAPHGKEGYLLILFHTPMVIHFSDGKCITTKPNACILYTPTSYQNYYSVNKFHNSYINFYADDSFVERLNIPTDYIFYPNNYEGLNLLFRDISNEFYLHPLYWEYKIDILIQNLLVEVSRSLNLNSDSKHTTNISLHSRFDQARLTILNNCQHHWTINEMCDLVNLGKSQFFKYYKQLYSCTPKDDLLKARINKAKHLITNENLSISNIAELCGFQSANYFRKCFYNLCGCTPSQYLKKKDSFFM